MVLLWLLVYGIVTAMVMFCYGNIGYKITVMYWVVMFLLWKYWLQNYGYVLGGYVFVMEILVTKLRSVPQIEV
jgi:hypothetical protein